MEPSESLTDDVRAPRRRRWFVLLLAIFASPVSIELALRVGGDPGVVMHEESGRKHRRVDDMRGHVLKPNHSVEVRYLDRAGNVLRTATMTANSLGMRGPLPSEGHPRIACIGDSHTYGFGVTDGEPWPRALERALRQRGYGEVQSMNFGVGAYETRHELEHMRLAALPQAPDIVVWQWFMNDAEVNGGGVERSALQRWTYARTAPGRSGAIRTARTYSRAADLACQVLHAWTRRDQAILDGFAERMPQHEAWQRGQTELIEARRVAVANGAKFAVVLHPLVVRNGDQFSSRAIDDHLRSFCEREDIVLMDLASTLDPREADRLRNSDLDYHPSAYCHGQVGDAVAHALADLGWLDHRAAPGGAAGR